MINSQSVEFSTSHVTVYEIFLFLFFEKLFEHYHDLIYLSAMSVCVCIFIASQLLGHKLVGQTLFKELNHTLIGCSRILMEIIF